MKKTNIKIFIEIAKIINNYPSFENLCIYMLTKDTDRNATGEAKDDLWWLWCETYPQDRKELIYFETERLERILNYIK